MSSSDPPPQSTTKRSLLAFLGSPFVAGLLAIFPLALTIGIIIWLADFLHGFVGPDSLFGRLVGAIGLNFVASERFAYLIGLAGAIGLIYILGLLVQAGMKNRWNALVDGIMKRVPGVRTIYNAAKQLTGMMNRDKSTSEIKSMSPVICHLGGPGGTALVALMPSSEKLTLHGRQYHAVMVPTAPVPFGGALLYVPVEWVEAAPFNVDGLVDVYMSMGVTSPQYFDGSGVLGQAASNSSPTTPAPAAPPAPEAKESGGAPGPS